MDMHDHDQNHGHHDHQGDTMDHDQNHDQGEHAEGYEAIEFAEQKTTDSELAELWLAAAQEAPTVEDLQLSSLELEEAERNLAEQRRAHQLAILQRVRVFGRGEVADALEISRKALAGWEAELQPEGDDLSGFYEELKKNREREARRAQRAAEKAAQQAASMERLLERIRNR